MPKTTYCNLTQLKQCGHGNGLNCEACKNVAPISSVNTLKDYLDGKHTKYSGSHMEAWHELKSSGYSLPVAPWRKELTIDNSITVDKEFKRDRKKFGDYSINELHWFRHIDVAKSIKEKGFLVDKKCLLGANIKARLILLEDDKWYVQIYSGLHRMSALAALGYETIILQLETNYVIRFQDRKYWPLVKTKMITEQEVLQYFHKL